MLKPGDASMASPFTAKATGVMPCTDIIRQGRATLVTTLQMFKILGLICLQTAYSLSVQYLQVGCLTDLLPCMPPPELIGTGRWLLLGWFLEKCMCFSWAFAIDRT